jgi:DNA-binding transcriptional ArsR family regulator
VKTLVHRALPAEPTCRTDLAVPDVHAQVRTAALLADHTRSTILAMLRAGPACVCEMAGATRERPNNVSNHLARLREAGVVRAVRNPVDARWVYYERDEAACAAALADLRLLLEPPA